MSLTDKTLATNIVLEKAVLDTAPVDLDYQLDSSAGTNAQDETVFRPYYLAAFYIRTEKFKLLEGDGAVFAEWQSTIDGLLDMQRDIDTAEALIIPEGREASAIGMARSTSLTRVI